MNMSTELEKHGVARPTGRRYDSVSELMRGEAVLPEVQQLVSEIEKATTLVQALTMLRLKAGLTQEQMAERLGVTQSAVSKLESGRDEDLTVKQIGEYAKATGQRIGLAFGKPLNHVEAVKIHAFGIRQHLSALAETAQGDEDLEQAVQAFFGEAFFNLLEIFEKCHELLPRASAKFEVKLQLLGPVASKPKTRTMTGDLVVAQ